MGAKKDKFIRRQIRKEKRRLWGAIVKELSTESFFARFRFAWYILFKLPRAK